MDDHESVGASLGDFIEVKQCAAAHGARHRAIHPARVAAEQQMPPEQIGRGGVLIARDRDQLATELLRHVLNEARLSAARGPFHHERQTRLVGVLENRLLLADG